MTKSIIIKEFATDKTLSSVKKVVTKRLTASDIEWLPEDECNLIQKTFTKRGTYRASDYNAYGFSKVTVNMSKSKNAEPQKNGEHKIIKPSVTIMEGEVGKTLGGISRLRIKNTDGDFSRWIPEANVELADRSIKGNGVFIASKDGVYGYSKVVITTNNNKRIITKPDGNEYSQDIDDNGEPIIDDDTGEPIEEILPSSIRIVGNPTQMTYNDNESINKAGMVVKAYCGDGSLYNYSGYEQGMIPLSELTIDPTKAKASESEDETWGKSGISAQVLTNGQVLGAFDNKEIILQTGDPSEGDWSQYKILGTKYNGEYYFACKYDGEYQEGATALFRRKALHYTSAGRVTTKFMKFSEYKSGEFSNVVAESSVNPYLVSTSDFNKLGGGQDITVSWKRPEDEKELTDTFTIAVNK